MKEYFIPSRSVTRSLNSSKDLTNYFVSLRGNNTRIYTPNGGDVFINHVDDGQIFWNEIQIKGLKGQKYGATFNLPAPDFQLQGTQEVIRTEHGMVISFADSLKNRMLTEPMSWKAYSDSILRAGFAHSPALLKEKSRLSWKDRADIINEGFHDYTSGKLFILVRNERVLAILSQQYQYIAQEELYNAIVERIRKVHPKATFASGLVSWDFSLFDIFFNDEEADEAFRMTMNHMLQDADKEIEFTSLRSGLRFTTSDTGRASMTVSGFMEVSLNGSEPFRIPCGRSYSLNHEGKVTVKDVVHNVEKILAKSFQDFEDRIEALGMMEIHDLGLVLNYLNAHYGADIPTSILKPIAEDKMGQSGSGIDIILVLNEVATKYLQKPDMSMNIFLLLYERINTLMWSDFVRMEKDAKEENQKA